MGFSVESFAGPLGYKDGRWVFKLKESYFTSSSNFNRLGTVKPLPPNQSFSTLTSSLSITHDLSNELSLFAVLDAVYGRSVGSDFERTRFAPTEVKLGADFLLWESFINVVPEFMLTVPITSIAKDTDEAIVSDGVFEARAGAYISNHFDWISGYAYGGLAFRSGGRSMLFPYEVQLVKAFDSLQISSGFWGYVSILDDEFTSVPGNRTGVTDRVNGGSYRFYSVNPTMMEAGGALGLALGDQTYGRLGLSHTLAGEQTANGFTVWLSVSYSFGADEQIGESKHREKVKKIKKIEEQKQKEFQPDTYKEEKYFEDSVQIIRKQDPVTPEEDDSEKEDYVPEVVNPSASNAPLAVKLRKKRSAVAPAKNKTTDKSKKTSGKTKSKKAKPK